MTVIRLFANDQKLSVVVGPKLASGDQKSVHLNVNFSGNWAEYEKSAVFFTSWNKSVYEVMLDDNRCVIPHEVLAKTGDLFIGVRGVDPDTQAVKTSALVKYKIERGAPVGDATSVEPTPDVYQQILAKLAEIKEPEKIRVIVAEYLAEHPPKPGYTPIRGVDYYTDADKVELVNEVLAVIPVAEDTVRSVNGVGADENGNVELDIPECRVQSVNGIAPDENGNVEVETMPGNIEQIAMLAEVDMLPAVHENGAILTDENGNVILRY